MPTNITLPDILPYPGIQIFDDVPELHSKFVYVIHRYPESGLALSIVFKDDNVCIRTADFDGNLIDVNKVQDSSKRAMHRLSDIIHRIVISLKYMKVPQSMIYLSDDEDDLKLVDLRVSINKFAGPGFIKDIFGAQGLKTQIVKETVQLDSQVIENIKNLYDGEFIIKPSSFKMITRDDDLIPMYGKIID